MPICQKKLLKPGIIHLKSITPSKRRIAEMKFLKTNGFMITSIDEEVGVVHDDTEYLNQRYGKVTVNLIDKLFAHGNFDLKNLIKKFPKYKKKIINSGNPRFDFWRNDFKNFFLKISYINKKIFYFFNNIINIILILKVLKKINL